MTDKQATAFTQLRALARPFRFRVVADSEGFPLIPGKLGAVEVYCDGTDCHGCPLPGVPALAVFTTRRRLHATIRATPGVRVWQAGDDELRAVFPAEPAILATVAGIIRAKRRRPPESGRTPEQMQAVRAALMRARSRPQDRVGPLAPASR